MRMAVANQWILQLLTYQTIVKFNAQFRGTVKKLKLRNMLTLRINLMKRKWKALIARMGTTEKSRKIKQTKFAIDVMHIA